MDVDTLKEAMKDPEAMLAALNPKQVEKCSQLRGISQRGCDRGHPPAVPCRICLYRTLFALCRRLLSPLLRVVAMNDLAVVQDHVGDDVVAVEDPCWSVLVDRIEF